MKIVQGIFSTLLCAVLIGKAAHAQDEDPVEALYQKSVQAVELANEPLDKLSVRYVAQLETLKKKTQKGGDLQMVLTIQSEIENHQAVAVEREFRAVLELRRLRGIYDQAYMRLEDEIRQKQFDIMKQAEQKFSDLKLSLTKEGQLELALTAERYRKDLESQIEKSIVLGSVPRIAQVESDYDFAPFAVGSIMCTNRGYQWSSVPEGFLGYTISLAPGGSKEKLRFRVKTSGLVSILAEPDSAKGLISDGWEKVGTAVRPPSAAPADVLQKVLEEGEHEFPTPLMFLGIRLLQPPVPGKG